MKEILRQTRVHTGFENLQRNCTPNRLLLLGQEDDAKSGFADRFPNLVGADVVMFPFVKSSLRRNSTVLSA